MAAGQHNNAAGVRKYFFFIKESVSSDWKDLAFHLDFRRSDTDNIAGRNRDDKSRCMDLLEEWLKRNGERANIEVLMEALSEAKLQSTVDGLRDEYPELVELSRQSDDRGLRGLPNTPPISQGTCPRPETSCHSEHASEATNYVRKRKGAEERQMSGSHELTKRRSLRIERREYDKERERLSTDRLDQDTERFRDAVKSYYDATITTFKPAIWNDRFTLRLSDIFTNLELSTKSTEGKESKRSKLNSLDDLFKSEVTGRSTAPRCILIEGEAGGGKTTFLSKEALDAVSQKTELGRRHDIVLLIRLREVWEGETIEEMVWDQCVDETTEGIEAQSIRTILQRNKSRVLFLLDGYDELRPEARAARQAIPKLLSGKMYPKSTIVITSRPSAGVQQYTKPDCHVHIMGFTPEHVEKYVRQYFEICGNAEAAEKLIKVLEESHLVTDLLHTPIFLMLVCVLWEENPDMVSPGTMTGLYSNLLTCLGRKHCKREGVDMPTDGLPTDLADALLQIGKLALEALLRGETLLDVSQAEKEQLNWKLLLKLGVISLEVSASKWNPRKQLNFSHKTMQEFLAGRYVANALVNQDIAELLQLNSISKALEHGNLLQFMCGCDSRAAKAVMEELSQLRIKEFSDLNVDALRESITEGDDSVETYKRFVLLCFDILNERKEPDVLEALSNVLPVIIIKMYWEIKKSPAFELALKYYLENLESLHLSNRMIIEADSFGNMNTHLQRLEKMFTSPVPGLQLYLDLTGVSLDSPDQTARLASVLKKVPGLRALNLSWAHLTPALLRPLVQGFHHMYRLEELNLTGNDKLGDAGMETLQAGLSSVPHLAVLRLGDLNMTAAGMSLLTPHLRHLAGLRELDLSWNDIGDTGLASLTTILPTFIAMQVLNLARNGISPTGMRTLVPALHKLTGLIKLDISNNYAVGDTGLECFAAILPHLAAIKVLNLSHIGISPQSMAALVAGLCKLTGLIKLDISDNDIEDPGLECLAAILPHLIAMKVLVLSETGISDRGISALVKTLPHLVQLQVLDVSDNNIGDSGIVSLVQTLCQSSQDMEQNLPSNKSEATAPRYNTTLQRLDIGHNRGVTGAGLGRVAQAISALPALTSLHMSGRYGTPAHLPDTAAMALAEALSRLPALDWLDLQNISMDPVGFQAVVQAAEEHPTLERLLYSKKLVPAGADTRTGCLSLW